MTTTAESSGGARRDGGAQKEEEEKEEKEEKSFLSNLHCFMKERGAPIERIPHLGFKQSEEMRNKEKIFGYERCCHEEINYNAMCFSSSCSQPLEDLQSCWEAWRL